MVMAFPCVNIPRNLKNRRYMGDVLVKTKCRQNRAGRWTVGSESKRQTRSATILLLGVIASVMIT